MLSYIGVLALAISAIATPVARQSCADVTVYFARGTGESGTIGTIVGPPFQSALQSALGSRTLQFIGIAYPASVAGFLEGGDPGGATTMANSVTSKASSCPNTKIVISGYRCSYLVSPKVISNDVVFEAKVLRLLTLLLVKCLLLSKIVSMLL
jgi:cutinase